MVGRSKNTQDISDVVLRFRLGTTCELGAKKKEQGPLVNKLAMYRIDPGMKEKAPLIILLATTLGLGILLVVQHNKAKASVETITSSHQKNVKEFEGQIDRLTQNLRGNKKELDDQAKEVGSLKSKLVVSETNVRDVGTDLENIVKARDKALEDLAEKDSALKQNQQELLDTKTNVTAVEAKLSDKTGELEQKISELNASEKALAQATTKLAKADVDLEKKNETLIAALKDLEDGQARIAKLETDLQAVNQQVGGLKTQIGSLEKGIESTQKKLTAAVGDRAFLLRELKRMQDEKAELEKHLNSLEYVRAQYKKLKSEWAASERLRMIREGIGYYGHPNRNVKGVTNLRRLAHRDKKPISEGAAEAGVNPDQLNVELKSDGTITIVEPGREPKVVLPDAKAIEFPNAGKSTIHPSQVDSPKGVVTPAPESVLPKLEINPTPLKTTISPIKPTPAKVKRAPKNDTPAALTPGNGIKSSPSKKSEPAANPNSDKSPPPPNPKPASKLGESPVPKPAPDIP